jgi:phosphocarrier protein HPr
MKLRGNRMLEQEVVIKNKTGLHARPAKLLVEIANKFESDILIIKGEREVNAKSILGVLTLGAGLGSSLVIRTNGSDEEEALSSINELIQSKFGESE